MNCKASARIGSRSCSSTSSNCRRQAKLRRAVSAVGLALFAGVMAAPARADLWWDTNGTNPGATDRPDGTAPGTWGVDPFWSYNWTYDGTMPTSAWDPGEVAIFSAYNYTYPSPTPPYLPLGSATAPYTVNVFGQQSVDSVQFYDPFNVTLSGGELNLVAGGTGAIVVYNSATINSKLSGSVTLTVSGGGTLTLGGTNTYTGGTKLGQGMLVFSQLNNLGAPAQGSTFLQFTGAATLKYVGTSDQIINGGIVVDRNVTGYLDLAAGTTTTVTGSGLTAGISGQGGITINPVGGGTGTLILGSANTYSGQTNIYGGRLIITNGAALGTYGGTNQDTVLQNSSANLTLRGGITVGETIRLTGGNGTMTGLGQFQSEGQNILNGNVVLASGSDGSNGPVATLATIGMDAGSSLTVNGLVQPITTGSAAGLGKVGAGSLILGGSSPNTYRGGTDVFGGYLIAAKDGAFGNDALGNGIVLWPSAPITHTVGLNPPANTNLSYTVGATQNIKLAGYSNDALGEGLLHNYSGNNTWAGGIGLGNGGNSPNAPMAPNTIGVASNTTLTVQGSIGNSGNQIANLTKIGGGTLVLDGVNTSSGPLIVAGGTLSLRSRAALPSSGTWTPGNTLASSINVLSGATLQFDNTEAVNVARLPYNKDLNIAVPINLYSGEFSLIGNAADVVQQNPGGFNASGYSTITLVSPGGTTKLVLSDINRTAHSTMLFRSFGTLGQGTGPQALLSTPPNLIGGGTSGIGNLQIIPWAIGDPSPYGSSGTDFVTYDPTYGVRLLSSTDYHYALEDDPAGYNVSISAPAFVSGQTHINSLRLTAPESGPQPNVNMAGSATLQVNSGAIFSAATLPVSFGGGTIEFGSNEGYITNLGDMSIGSSIDGTGGIAKGGAGTLTLLGNNTFSGGLSVNSGTVVFSGDSNLGAVPAVMIPGTINLNGGVLQLDPSVTSLALNPLRGLRVSSLSGGLRVAPGQTLIVGTTIDGPGVLQVQGGGTVILGSPNNSYQGGVLINGSTLGIAVDGALGVGLRIGINGGTLRGMDSFTMDVNRWMLLSVLGGTISIDPGKTVSMPGTIIGAGGLVKTGGGMLSLSGVNSYLGATRISAGVLDVPYSESLGAATSPLIFDGGTLRASGYLISQHPTTVNATGGTLDVPLAATNAQFSGGFTTAPGSTFTKIGPGTMTLLGQHDFGNGASFNVSQGTLVVNSTPSGTGTGGVTVAAPGTLAGTGSILGSVTLGPRGLDGSGNPTVATIRPSNGTSPGQLTIGGGLDLSTGGVFDWQLSQLSTTSGFGSISLTGGNLGLGGLSALNLDLGLLSGTQLPTSSNSFWRTAHIWKIIDVAGGTNPGNATFATVLNDVSYAGNGYVGGKFIARTATSGTDAGDVFVEWAPIAQWQPDSGGSWGDAANWVGGMLPQTDAMLIGSPKSLYGPQTAPVVITLDADRTIANLTLDGTVGSPAPSFTIAPGSANGGANHLIFDNGGSGANLRINSGNQAITAPVSINDNTTFTIANGSTLTVGNGGAVTTAIAAHMSLTQSGGTLAMDAISLGDDYASFRINSGNANVGTIAGGGTLSVLNSASTLTAANVNVDAGRTMNTAGAGVVTIGTVSLADATSTFRVQSGTTNINTINYGGGGAGSVKASGGTLVLNGTANATITLSGTSTLSGNAIITGGVVAAGSDTAHYPLIIAGSSTAPGALTMAGLDLAGIPQGPNLNSGGAFLFRPTSTGDLNSSFNYGTITLTGGTLALGGFSRLQFDMNALILQGLQPGGGAAGSFWSAPHSWKLIDVPDAPNNPGNTTFAQLLNAGTYSGWAFGTHVGSGTDAGDVFLDWVSLTNEWNGVNGSFGDVNMWIRGVVPTGVLPGGDAKFRGLTPDGALSGKATVTLDTDRIIPGITFDPAANGSTNGTYEISGGPSQYTLNFYNGGTTHAQINVNSGSHSITAPVLITDSTDANVVNASSTLSMGGVTINAGKAMTLSGAGTLSIDSLNLIDGASSFEVKGGKASISGVNGITSGSGGMKATGGELALSGVVNAPVTVGTTLIGTTTVSGTLSGTATINGPVVGTAASASKYGVIIPGSSSASGVMTMQAGLDLSGGGALLFKPMISGGPTFFDYGTIDLTGGNLVLGGTSKLKFDFSALAAGGLQPGGSNSFWTAPHTWKLIDLQATAANPGGSNFVQFMNAGTYGGWYFATHVGTGTDAGDIFLDWATNEWNGGDGSFGDNAMWTGQTIPIGVSPGGDAKFLGRTPSGPLSGMATVTLDTSRMISGIILDPAAGGSTTGGYTISGGPSNYSLNLANSGLDSTITVRSGSHVITAAVFLTDNTDLNVAPASGLSMGGVTINAGKALTQTGGGTLSIANLNLTDGVSLFEIKGGTAIVGNVNGTPGGSGGLKATGGELALTGFANAPVSVGPAGTLSGAATIGGSVTAAGTIIPGSSSSPGTMFVAGGLDMSGGGTLLFKPVDLGNGFGRIVLTGGNLVLGGSSKLSLDMSALSAGGIGPDSGNAFWGAVHHWEVVAVNGGSNPSGEGFSQLVNAPSYPGWSFATHVSTTTDPGSIFLDWQSTTPEWIGGSGASNDPDKWGGSVPMPPYWVFRGKSAPSGTINVTIDGAQTSSGMTFDPAYSGSSASYNLVAGAGGGSLALANGGMSVQVSVASGSHSITAAVMIQDNTTVDVANGSALALDQVQIASGKTLEIASGTGTSANAINGGNLKVDAAAKLTLTLKGANKGGKGTASSVDALTIVGGGQVDLANNSLSVAGSSDAQLVTINNMVKSGYHGGAWDGPGIVTSAYHATQIDGTDKAPWTTIGVAVVGGNVVAKYTYQGDVDLNGIVNAADFAQIKYGSLNQNNGLINGHAVTYADGDVDYNGVINAADFAMTKSASLNQGGSLAISAPENLVMPEPGTMGILAIGAIGLLGRKRRR